MKKSSLVLGLSFVSFISFAQTKTGDTFFSEGEYAQAIPLYESTLKSDPDNIYVWSQLMESYGALYRNEKQTYFWSREDDKETRKNYELAVYYAKKILSKDERNKKALIYIANLHYMNKEIPEALMYVEKYKQFYSGDEEDVSYFIDNMYTNLVSYLIETSTSLETKEKYINKINDLDVQFNYLYVEFLIEKEDFQTLKSYVNKLQKIGEVVDYKYILNRSLRYDKSESAVFSLVEISKSEGKPLTPEQAQKEIPVIKEKFQEVVRHFSKITVKNYKNYMVKSEEELDEYDIKTLQNLNYDNLNIYKGRKGYELLVSLEEYAPDTILASLYGDPGVYGYSLQIVNDPQGFKIQILD